jgi:hypothetical protein
MTMKKILKEWKTYLKEEPDHTLDDNQVRANVAKKMGTILFAPINNPREQDRIKASGGPESIIAMGYIYYAVFGEDGASPPDVDLAKIFVEAKVKYFLDKLSRRELDILKLDAVSLLNLSNFKDLEERPPTIPKSLLKANPGLAKVKNTPVIMISGSAVSDWGMGGSLPFLGRDITDYTFQLIADSLEATEESPLSEADLIAIYCLGQESSNIYDDDEAGSLKDHPAAGASWEEFQAWMKSKQGK